MTIQDLGSIGEFVGSIATVATLVYLAVQIRQNSSLLRQSARTLELESLHHATSFGADLRALLFQNEALLSFWLRGCADPSSLDRTERIRFGLIAQNVFYGDQAMWTRIQAEAMSSEAHSSPVPALLSQPGVADWWNRNQRHFRPAYVAAVEASRKRAAQQGAAAADPQQVSIER